MEAKGAQGGMGARGQGAQGGIGKTEENEGCASRAAHSAIKGRTHATPVYIEEKPRGCE